LDQPFTAEYIRGLLDGREEVERHFYGYFGPLLVNKIRRDARNRELAEDAAQETFLRAFAQLRRYDPTRSFKTWLLSIASHHCIDRLRKRRQTWVSIEDDELPPHPNLREPNLGPEETTVRREQSAVIQKHLSRLAPNDRQMIVMRYWYDLSYEEIAQATGATVSAVKSRLHRARGNLAEMLETARSSAPRPLTRPALATEG
jgi:RNA polymerase sigma-70 factor (ECF subfamily)